MNEVVRLLADWLSGTLTDANGDDQGVNVQLAALTRDGSDPQPPDVTVTDETRNSTPARGEPEDNGPEIVVSLVSLSAESTTLAPASGPRLFEATLQFRYVAREGDTKLAVSQAYYTAYAVLMSWSYLMRGENEAKRTRNGWSIIPYSAPGAGFELYPLMAQREDDHVGVGWTLRVQVRRAIP